MNFDKFNAPTLDKRSKLIYGFYQRGNFTKFPFIRKFIEKMQIAKKPGGGIPIPLSCKQDFADKLIEKLELVNEMFPERWDLLPYVNEGIVGFELLIHYPELEITNTEYPEQNTIVKDLFVCLRVMYNNEQVHFGENIYGIVTTLSEFHAINNYRHSHLRSINVDENCFATQEHSFCIGSSGDLPYMLGELSHSYDPMQFQYFLFCLDTMVKTESEEGGPFVRVRSLGTGDINTVTESNALAYANTVFEGLQSHFTIVKMPFNFYLANNRIKIKQDKVLYSYLREKAQGSSVYRTIMVKNTPSGYVNLKESADNNPIETKVWSNQTVPFIYFRGNKFSLKILRKNPDIRVVKEEEYNIHPLIVNHVSSQLERAIQKAATAGSRIAEYHSGRDAGDLPF